MPPPPPAFPLRPTPSIPWRPLTDPEWHALQPLIRPTARGRPPRDLRRTWDGIFWIACSRAPWRDLPAEFGRADTAHRALRRAAEAKRLHALLLHISPHPLFARDPLHAVAWFIARAFRRAFRVAPHAIAYARRLGMASALPAAPCWLPDPDLSEAVRDIARKAIKSAEPLPIPFLRALHYLSGRAAGDPARWTTTA